MNKMEDTVWSTLRPKNTANPNKEITRKGYKSNFAVWIGIFGNDSSQRLKTTGRMNCQDQGHMQ